jgi:endonuclease-3
MTQKERYKHILAWFETNMPVAESELHYSNPFELVIAVCLSAQCTDKRVNMVTPKLFHDFPTPEALAATSSEVVFEYIKSVSYPNNKAKNLVAMAQKLVSDFHSEVPQDIDLLQTLPGVGRKTANVVATVAFNANAMPVDTHVFRVSNRLGLVNNTKTPLATEKELVKNIPAEKLGIAHHWILLHGRYVCVARAPKCKECGLKEWCRAYELRIKN